jgi:hypothetical protein
MSNLFNISAIIAVFFGMAYFILRFALFIRVTSFSIEMRKMMAFEYFLTIKSTDVNLNISTINLLNWLLRITYVFYGSSMIIAITKSIMDEFVK